MEDWNWQEAGDKMKLRLDATISFYTGDRSVASLLAMTEGRRGTHVYIICRKSRCNEGVLY